MSTTGSPVRVRWKIRRETPVVEIPKRTSLRELVLPEVTRALRRSRPKAVAGVMHSRNVHRQLCKCLARIIHDSVRRDSDPVELRRRDRSGRKNSAKRRRIRAYDSTINPRDRKNRRLFLGELKDADREKLRLYFARNPAAIVKRVLLGNSAVAPEWMLIVRQVKSTPEYRLVAMETAIAFFATGPVQMTSGPGGNLAIGNLTMQRKGGDSGDPRPNDLQFKVRLEDFWTKLSSSQ